MKAGNPKESLVQLLARTHRSFLAGTIVAACISLLACEDPIPPPEPPGIPPTADDVLQGIARAYLTRDWELFASLLAPDFKFVPCKPTVLGETEWGYEEEVRIHQRMFHPQTADPPLAPDLWLQALTITLTKQENFAERFDFYSADGGMDGKLDPALWRVVDARYTTYVFFDLVGTDYKVEGEANFVVLENLAKPEADAGRFLLLMWEEICPPAAKPAQEA